VVEFSEVLRRRTCSQLRAGRSTTDWSGSSSRARAPSAATRRARRGRARRRRACALLGTRHDRGMANTLEALRGALRAPVVALSLASPAAYVERYSEPDKAPRAGRHRSAAAAEAWPSLLVRRRRLRHHGVLLAARRGVGAAFLGNFRHEHELLAPSGAAALAPLRTSSWAPDGGDHRSASLDGSASLRRGGPAPRVVSQPSVPAQGDCARNDVRPFGATAIRHSTSGACATGTPSSTPDADVASVVHKLGCRVSRSVEYSSSARSEKAVPPWQVAARFGGSGRPAMSSGPACLANEALEQQGSGDRSRLPVCPCSSCRRCPSRCVR